ncbi:hypothetical protein ON021_06760, partial [Microcoleus sp. HI-ES]|nr:hypothetical protein [Microcoleus sp. HI-ES]
GASTSLRVKRGKRVTGKVGDVTDVTDTGNEEHGTFTERSPSIGHREERIAKKLPLPSYQFPITDFHSAITNTSATLSTSSQFPVTNSAL